VVVSGDIESNALSRDDWLIVEQRYRLGADTVEDIAKAFGITSRLINSRATKNAWIRDAREVKRAVVDQAMSTGIAPDPNGLVRDDDVVGPSYTEAIATAAVDDVKDMTTVLTNARRVLARLVRVLDSEPDLSIKELGGFVEVNHRAMMTIRVVRGLGERDVEDTDLTKALARARSKLVIYDSR
jgi:hypothetical protein